MLSTHEDELVYSAFKNLPENPTMKCKQLIEKYGSSTTDHINLRSLLDSWNLGNLFNFFIDQHLYVDILKHLSPEMARTLFHHTNIPLGAQIVFYNRWSQWIKESGTTIPPAIENKPQQSNEIRKNHQPTRLGFFNTNLVKSQKPISTINLNAVMRSNKYGSTVISAFNSRKSLDDNLRKLLCDCVLQYCIEFHHELSVGDCASLARQIVDTFPGEVAAYYYLERKNNPPLGRLYSKYRNWKKTLIRKASIKTDSRKKKVQAFTVNDDEEAHICALKSESSNMTFDERMEHWMGCWGTRNNAIRQRGGQSLSEQLLTDWPLYKNPDGHRFIDADFAYLYGCKSDFMDRSETFAELMIDTILPRHMNVMKRNGCEEQFGMLQSKRNYLSKNSILALVLQLTLAILPLSRIKTKNSGTSVGASASEKRIWYTIKESQDAFMAICATEAHYKAVYESKVKNESAVPPYLSIIGSIENLECVMVDFFNVSYKFHSLAEAIDTAIKVYFVFNMPYPEPCQAIWDFINKGFYRIPDLNTVTKPPTILLVTEIEKIMKNQIVEL